MAVWLIIVIAVVVIALVAAGVWYLGYPLTGFDRLRASATEAGERASDQTADFVDWVRFGR